MDFKDGFLKLLKSKIRPSAPVPLGDCDDSLMRECGDTPSVEPEKPNEEPPSMPPETGSTLEEK